MRAQGFKQKNKSKEKEKKEKKRRTIHWRANEGKAISCRIGTTRTVWGGLLSTTRLKKKESTYRGCLRKNKTQSRQEKEEPEPESILDGDMEI